MICKKCGKEFDGSFCPNCGNKANDDYEQAENIVLTKNESNSQKPLLKKLGLLCKKPLFWVLIVLSIIVIILSLLLISSNNSNNSNNRIEDNLQTSTTDTKVNDKSTNSETDNKIIDKVEVDTPDKDTTSSEEGVFKSVTLSDKISLDFVKMTFEKIAVSEAIYPTDTSGVYSYMSEKDGEQYFYLKGSIQNISGNAYSVENMVGKLVFDDKYTYSCFLIADDGGNDFYGDYVKPLSSVKYYIYSSVPDEIVTTYSTCTFYFGFKDCFSGSYYDSLDECDYLYKISAKK